MNQKIQIRKSLYKKEAIIVALQMYLKKYWVAILEDESDYFIQFEPKNGNNIKISENEFINQLIEAEFIYMKSLESLPLRKTIMKKALEPYYDKND
ncbi:MAG: hypothetical protein QF852_03295 [Candidatus Marinimicrobia bacterium]|jgi:His-Xaa-Ser system protein HxsD|nr:hypothetical protein [Candidatus Neomarinimicrobiota bacterium]MDP6134031.1 hypothetical protein [Candidatus Neomarinimicrobiota bacterium]MDP6260724.1 hypothetical protein [Candidatus Neomarinimicrobiota bacterium]MDP7526632.1 hypothetical protein [Candidatus Neomarinimicrobiota bacterium]|tara:strand:- start:293 stop:580 length:288 start_codon:yes stop_codon:yes gene_type:complete